MMRQIVTLIFTITLLNINAQTFSPNFLGDDFLLYKGVKLKLKEDSIAGFPFSFYSDLKYCNSNAEYNVIYRDPKYPKITVRDSLLNRIFIVEDIVNRDGIASTGTSILDKPIFILKDLKTNQKIYYKYDNDFPFLTTPIAINKNAMCSRITKSVNNINGNIIYNSPVTNNNQPSFAVIEKYKTNLTIEYYLSLQTIDGKGKSEGSGVIIYFTDGTKLLKQAVINAAPKKDHFVYSVYFSLSEKELDELRTKNIKKFTLHVYEKEVNPVDSDKFKAYVNCILETQ